MNRGVALAVRWIGRALLLFGPLVLAASLFLPSSVQFLNGAVCPTGTHLSNARQVPAGVPNDNKMELVCTSTAYSVTVGAKIVLIAVGSVAIGLILLWISQRSLRPTYRAPVQQPVH